jgi:uncharacterized protein (TIGR03435 family)
VNRPPRYLLLCLAIAAGSIPAAAQGNALTDSANAGQTAKPFTFEVVSIHPRQPGTYGIDQKYLPDGFQASFNLDSLIRVAYTPESGSLKVADGPAWAYTDFYDIQARISPENLAGWRGAHDIYHSEPLRLGLQAALKDRFKLQVHTTLTEQSCLDLVIGKQGHKLEPAAPGPIKTVPGKTWVLGDGFYVQDNGKRQFMNVSMEEFALLLTRLNNGHLVQDKTGLTGRFDFALPVDNSPDNDGSTTIGLDRMPVTGVGLALKPGTAPFLNIYIDHIERPDAN